VCANVLGVNFWKLNSALKITGRDGTLNEPNAFLLLLLCTCTSEYQNPVIDRDFDIFSPPARDRYFNIIGFLVFDKVQRWVVATRTLDEFPGRTVCEEICEKLSHFGLKFTE
jgi:hypothetical protein